MKKWCEDHTTDSWRRCQNEDEQDHPISQSHWRIESINHDNRQPRNSNLTHLYAVPSSNLNRPCRLAARYPPKDDQHRNHQWRYPGSFCVLVTHDFPAMSFRSVFSSRRGWLYGIVLSWWICCFNNELTDYYLVDNNIILSKRKLIENKTSLWIFFPPSTAPVRRTLLLFHKDVWF